MGYSLIDTDRRPTIDVHSASRSDLITTLDVTKFAELCNAHRDTVRIGHSPELDEYVFSLPDGRFAQGKSQE